MCGEVLSVETVFVKQAHCFAFFLTFSFERERECVSGGWGGDEGCRGYVVGSVLTVESPV